MQDPNQRHPEAAYAPDFSALSLLPPQNLAAEEAILRSILNTPKSFEKVVGILSPEMFYYTSHATIYRAMVGLYGQGILPDLMQVTTWLHNSKSRRGGTELEEIGCITKLTELVEPVFWVDLDNAVKVVYAEYQRRKLIEVCQGAITLAHDKMLEASELFSTVEEQVLSLRRTARQEKRSGIFEEITLRQCDRLRQTLNSGISTTVNTGLYDLDAAFGGLRAGEFSVIAGASNIGKSALVAAITYLVATQGHPVYFASYEMPEAELWARIVACHTGIDSSLFRTPEKLTAEHWDLIDQHIPDFVDMRIYVDFVADKGVAPLIQSFNQADLEFRSRLGDEYKGIKVLIVDYLQLVAGSSENRPGEMDAIAKEFKRIAMEKDVHVLALAQIDSAGVAKRNNKRPELDDLSYCKTIKDHADIVGMLYRESYYDPHCDLEERHAMEVWIRKHRHLPKSMAKIDGDLSTCRFRSRASGGFTQL